MINWQPVDADFFRQFDGIREVVKSDDTGNVWRLLWFGRGWEVGQAKLLLCIHNKFGTVYLCTEEDPQSDNVVGIEVVKTFEDFTLAKTSKGVNFKELAKRKELESKAI